MGPLPSSIYWRRRAVLLCLLAVAAVIVIWVLNFRGGGGGHGSGAPSGSHTPVASITPGPEPTGTHLSGRPGGRDTSPGDDGSTNGGAADGGSSGTAGSAGTSGSDGSPGTTPGDGTTDGASSAGSASSSGTTTGDNPVSGSADTSSSGGPVAAGSALPDCAPGSVQLALSGAKNAYSPGDTPAFQLRATNSGGVACKLDFGPKSAVFTVTKAADNSHVWASDDCPARGAYLLQVPAHGSTTYTLRWNTKTSSPKCASPKGQQAAPGTYLLQAQLPGYPAKQVSFVLSAD